MKAMRYKIAVLLSLLSLPAMLLVATGGPAAAAPHYSATGAVTSSSLGSFKPTFAGPAATGCASNCSLLSGPVNTPSTAAAASGHQAGTSQHAGKSGTARAMQPPDLRHLHISAAQRRLLGANSPSNPLPSVSCAPLRPGCDNISTSAGGATAVKGLNAVDSAVAAHQPQRRHRAPGPGPVRWQRVCGRAQQHRRDPGLQHRFEDQVRADLARHHHGAHQAGMEQRRGHLLRVGPGQRRALVLHPDRLGQPGIQGRRVHRLLRGRGQRLLRGHRGHRRLQPVRPLPRVLLQRRLQPGRAGLPVPAQRLREDLGDPGRLPDVLRRVPASPVDAARLRRRFLQRGAGVRVQQERAGARPARRAGQRAAEPLGHGGEGEHGPDRHPGRDLRPRQGAARGRHHLLGGGDPGAAGGGPVRQRPRRHRVHAELAGLLRVRGGFTDFR